MLCVTEWINKQTNCVLIKIQVFKFITMTTDFVYDKHSFNHNHIIYAVTHA